MPNRQEVYSKTTGSPAVTERPKTTLLGRSVNNCLGATAITLRVLRVTTVVQR